MSAEPNTALVFPGCHPRGGVERVVWETTKHLSRRRPLTLVCSDADRDGTAEARIVHVAQRSAPRSLVPLLWRRAAGRALRAVARDVTVTYGVECPPGDVLVVQSVHRAWLEHGRPVQRGIGVPGWARYALPRHQVLLALETAYFRARSPRVIAVSDNVAADLTRLYGVDDDHIVVIPNGYDPHQCSPSRTRTLRDEMRAAIGLGPDDVALLLIANEWHRKGLKVLLEAAAALNDRRAHIVLVGRLAPEAFTGQIQRLGLAERVHYCGPTGDVGRYYAAADLFVLPTQYEAFGSVVVEALASGLPVITTARAGAAAAVRPGRNGLLQRDPDDVEELASLLREGLDGASRDSWRRAAPESVREYDWATIMTRMERAITEIGS